MVINYPVTSAYISFLMTCRFLFRHHLYVRIEGEEISLFCVGTGRAVSLTYLADPVRRVHPLGAVVHGARGRPAPAIRRQRCSRVAAAPAELTSWWSCRSPRCLCPRRRTRRSPWWWGTRSLAATGTMRARPCTLIGGCVRGSRPRDGARGHPSDLAAT